MIQKLTLCLLAFILPLSLTAQQRARTQRGGGADGPNAPWRNGKLVVSENHRYLQHENGTPFFWLGETAWLLPTRANRDEVGNFMGKTRRNGFNVVQISPLHSTGAMNAYGHWALPNGFDFTDIDKKGEYNYWQNVDFIVESARRSGIYVGIVCIWGGAAKDRRVTEETIEAYGKFLAERYKKYPNIIWIIGGDVPGNLLPNIWQKLATTIRAIDPDHLMTFHPRGRTMSATWFNNESWLDFNMFQSGHRRYNQRDGDGDYPIEENTEEDNWRFVERSLAIAPMKPVLDGEPSYEDIPHGLHNAKEVRWQPADVRRYAYWSVFAGACGHTYGHASTMQMLRPSYGAGYGVTVPWWEALDAPGCQQMKHVKKLMLTFPFADLMPDQSVISSQNGMQYDRRIACRGKDYLLVYNYTNSVTEIDLGKISGAKKKAWWYSPVTGEFAYIGEFDNGKHKFAHESGYRPGNDWVLVATDSEAKYIE